MSKYESVWETHDFVIQKLTINEDKYNHLLANMNSYVVMFKKGAIKREEILKMLKEGRRVCSALDSLYKKHLLSIREIRQLIKDDDVPRERVPTAEVVDELESSTRELMTTIAQSRELFDIIEEEINYG